jgi:two-component system, chemotaxis family, sensor kinase Cph1
VLRELAGEIAARGAAVTHDPLPVVPGDPEELATLLSQLLTNALRFGGEQVHVGAERRPLGWKLTVRDNGAGVPEAERQRIFQMFRRLHTRGAHRGAGVGLAVCQRIAERHGGAIWVEEADGGGSAFHVTLPDREAR